jgi:hypothetical protein
MRTKIFFCILFFTQSNLAYNEVCPSVADIKNNRLTPWIPLYIDNEERAFNKDVQQFKKNVTDFIVARWDSSYLENGHCFYQGTDPIISKIILANDAWRPVQGEKWQWKIYDRIAECYSNNVQDCEFIQ